MTGYAAVADGHVRWSPTTTPPAIDPDRINPTDADLLKACLAGEPEAWHQFIARYSRLIYSIARQRGLDREAAADVFQEVCIVVHRQLYSLQNHQAVVAWLITITQRQCGGHIRFNPQCETLNDDLKDDGAEVERLVRRWELRQVIDQAMDELEPRYRELLTALFLEPEPASYAQIAQRLGLSVGSIGPIRARCFKKFEAILKRRGFGDLAA